MTRVQTILHHHLQLSKPHRTSFHLLLLAFLTCPHRHNLTQLAPFASRSRRSLSRLSQKPFPYQDFNSNLLGDSLANRPVIAALDCSFLRKAGKHTDQLGQFYSGADACAKRGLELCSLALCTLDHPTAYSLACVQTPDEPEFGTRMDFYAKFVVENAQHVEKFTKMLVCDGGFARETIISEVLTKTNLNIVTKLQRKANMRYLFKGEHIKKAGRKKLYEGKVDTNNPDPEKMPIVARLAGGIVRHFDVLYHFGFKRRLAVMIEMKENTLSRILCSTKLDISCDDMVMMYDARFQQEFMFRDCKQHFGLMHNQQRKSARIEFHLNMSMSARNVAKQEIEERWAARGGAREELVYSMEDYKWRKWAEHAAAQINARFGVPLDLIKSLPAFSPPHGDWMHAA